MNEYANAYVEVLEILDNLIEEDYNKIPKEYISYMKEESNKDYIFKYDNSKSFKEQSISTDAKMILFFFYEEFAANKTFKEKINQYKMRVISNENEEKLKKCTIDNLGKKKIKSKDNNEIINVKKENYLRVKKENIFHKIMNFIISIFK